MTRPSFVAKLCICCLSALLLACTSNVPAPVSESIAGTSSSGKMDQLNLSPLVADVTFHYVTVNGISMRVAEMGNGPVVLLAHGWPESWYSWRHQINALAAAGYRVLAPDMRGYGESDAPQAVDAYNIVELSADMVGILDAFDVAQATMVGHDWGSIVASHSVLFHPQRFNGLILMSVPYRDRGNQSPMASMRERVADNFYYITYHNEPGGVAEKEYDQDPRGLLSALYLSPDDERAAPQVTDPKRSSGGWIGRLGAAKRLPDWLQQQDLDYYVSQFESAGFRGGVNYYRNIERNWQLTADLESTTIKAPALFIAGAKDVVIGGATAEQLTAFMTPVMPGLSNVVLIPGIGHWVQQEAPQQTNQAMLKFLQELAPSSG